MEALSLSLPTITAINSNLNYGSLGAASSYASLSSLQHRPSSSTILFTVKKSVVRAQADNEDFELKQVRDMAAAKKRWEALLREEKIKVLTPKEAGYAVQLSNKPLLDVRPSNEHNKAWVKGSTWIPIFDVDNGLDIGTIPRKVSNFAMGGWWSGMPTLSFDNSFLPKVMEKFPKDAELIVACQKGLRSLAACEQLYNAGYTNLFWVQGGFEAAEEKDHKERVLLWSVVSFSLLVVRYILEILGIPVSKALYRLSYMFITAEASGLVLTSIYYIVDVTLDILANMRNDIRFGDFLASFTNEIPTLQK